MRYGHIAVALVIITGVISAITLLPGWPLNYSGSEYQSLLWFKDHFSGNASIGYYQSLLHRTESSTKGRVNTLIINSWVELPLGTMAILWVAIFASYQPI
ncbi:hypothetical protein [Providencia hangzhouensis]|uniref:hypothetical protein n=1 Tax=Providencia hangzhouensis TaxID=3031799 RepID=UPI0034DD28AF